MLLPRILIFGQPFNKKYGGGITLTNLFKGWDKNRIAVAATGHVMTDVTTDVCDTYYQLGVEEFKWRFPFNLFQKKFPSGIISFNDKLSESPRPVKKGRRRFFVTKVFYPALEWMGLYHSSSTYLLSDNFKEWLKIFKPDVLYLQISSYDTILFAHKLHDFLGIPIVMHMMDDWPSTISRTGPFKKFWSKRIDREIKRLLDKTDLCLSISEAMSAEYLRRYGKAFKPYHNPIDISNWNPYLKTDFTLQEDWVKILFSGRVGTGITSSLIEISDAINELNHKGIRSKLYIQSPSVNNDLVKRLSSSSNVIINPVARYSDLPAIYSNADILVIANNFDKASISFLKYSMPTKASEFMISGTPILVYSHGDTAVSKFFSENECGHCVTEHSITKLVDGFFEMISNENYRKELSRKAVNIASQQFDINKVRHEFQEDIVKITVSGDSHHDESGIF